MAELREEIKKECRWNVESMYPTFDDWKKDFLTVSQNGQHPVWKDIISYKGKLGEGAQTLKKAFDHIFEADRKLSILYTYAHLRHDEDIANDKHKAGFSQALMIVQDFGQAISWVEPELLSIPDETINQYLNSESLKDYHFHLEKLIRVKKHTLSADQEELLALSSKALMTPSKAFSALNDADFDFGKVRNEKNEELELSHATYGLFLREQDRTLRKNSFESLLGKYEKYENTLCELLNGVVQNHLFNAKARHYSSCLEASLFPKNIETSVYHALIQAVNENLAPLHKYMKLREKIMKVKPLHLYDMYVPLTKEVDIKMGFKEATALVIESVKPLGTDYQNLLKKGLSDDRWVDQYENKNKRSGAYSSGCYDSMPYILMNYKGVLRDVFTLAHEAGHSMHSLLSHKHQPYHYGDYPIFLAEVASTFNEELLMQLMLERSSSKEEQIYLINEKIEDIRGTLFRQTMFAEFELLIHELAEKNIPLTPALLKEKYLELNKKYFGPGVDVDGLAQIEWARIPHFYYNFYVYQYATGVSAALALADRVTKGGDQEREEYLSFLRSGSSKYPIETLKDAGVDMRTPKPIVAAINKFDVLVDKLALLLGEK